MNHDINELAEAIMARPDFKQGDKVLLSVYETARAYGGPEEGGWWYDHREYRGSVHCADRETAERLREEMLKELKGERRPHAYAQLGGDDTVSSSYPEGYIPRGWSGDTEYEVIFETTPGEHATRERPHYE